MQRDPSADNGVTEFLVANTALALRERGFMRLSLNFASWGRLFHAKSQLSVVERAMKATAQAMNPFFQIKSLYDFNNKFNPGWLSRSIVVEDPAKLSQGCAVVQRGGLCAPTADQIPCVPPITPSAQS